MIKVSILFLLALTLFWPRTYFVAGGAEGGAGNGTSMAVETPSQTAPIFKIVTAYSALDSCHNPVEDGCLTASGKIAKVGMVACPYGISFGTKVFIASEWFVCEDRTAKKYNGRFDIFLGYGKEAHQRAIEFGIRKLEVLF